MAMCADLGAKSDNDSVPVLPEFHQCSKWWFYLLVTWV